MGCAAFFPNATKARKVAKDYFRKHFNFAQRGTANEASNCNCLFKSWQDSQGKAQEQWEEKVKSKNVPTNKALYSRVKAEAKRRFKVYPSAYANGWLVKEYKKRGGKYQAVKEEKNG